MSTFVTPFTIPGNYTFDPNKIEVVGGLAKLREDLSSVYARWHLNESSGSNAPDDSGNNRNGTLINNPAWVAGKINNALAFVSASSQYVTAGDIAAFERTQPFSVESWIKTTELTDPTMIVARMQNVSPDRGWQFYKPANTGTVRLDLANNFGTLNVIRVTTVASINDGSFHHVVATYDGSSNSSGIKIYIDGVLVSVNQELDGLTGTIVPSGVDLNIGARGGIFNWNGDLDEVVIYNKELTAAEVSFRYNSGTGRENFVFHSDSPTIFKTLGDAAFILSWTNFVVTQGTVEGSLTYQLSEDGITWKFWNGSAWIVVGANDYNSEATINTNIATFPTVAQKIFVKTFFISDGTQRVEIDEIQITFASNQAPIVDAGTNKTVFDNGTISPFSDASFSDPDGTVDKAFFQVDGENTFTEILIGGFGTLLEAVQAFNYQFLNPGILTVRLKVEDNQGAQSEDSLTVTVNKLTVTFNVKDSNGNHLTNIDFNPDDGSEVQLLNSPFTWDYEFASFSPTFDKTGFVGLILDLNVTGPSLDFTIVLNNLLSQADISAIADAVWDEPLAEHTLIGSAGKNQSLLAKIHYSNKASTAFDPFADDQKLICWAERDGIRQTGTSDCVVTVRNQLGATIWTQSQATPNSDGVYEFTNTFSATEGKNFYIIVIIKVDGSNRTNHFPFFTV